MTCGMGNFAVAIEASRGSTVAQNTKRDRKRASVSSVKRCCSQFTMICLIIGNNSKEKLYSGERVLVPPGSVSSALWFDAFCLMGLVFGGGEKKLQSKRRGENRSASKMFVVIAQAGFCHENQQISTKDASILTVPE